MAISCQDPVQHLALRKSYFLAVAFPPFRSPWRKWATAVPLRRGKELSQQWRGEVVVCSDFASRCICMGTHTSTNTDLLCFTLKPMLRQWVREALKAPSRPLRAQCKGGFRSFGISLPRCLANVLHIHPASTGHVEMMQDLLGTRDRSGPLSMPLLGSPLCLSSLSIWWHPYCSPSYFIVLSRQGRCWWQENSKRYALV